MKKLKYVYYVSLFLWCVVFLLILTQGKATDQEIKNYPYLNYRDKAHDGKNDVEYKTLHEVFSVLTNLENYKNKQGSYLNSFEWCCDFIRFIGTKLHYDYQTMNMIFFVYTIPLFLLNILVILCIQHIIIRKNIT